jgi:hypothetical protein
MKIIIKSLFLFLILLFSVPAPAERIWKRSTESRAIGGVNTPTDITNPANSALWNGNFSFIFLNVDTHLSLSEGLNTYNWIMDVSNFKNNFNNISDVFTKQQKILELLYNAKRDFDLLTHVDLLSFIIGNKSIGKFHFGIYVDGFSGIRVRVPDTKKINVVGAAVDIGNNIDLVSGFGQGDSGVQLGYGKAFYFQNGMKVSAGIRNRTYYRFFAPIHNIHLNRIMDSDKDIKIPDFTYDSGIGTSFDLSMAFDTNDILNTRIAAEVGNVISNAWYGNHNERDPIFIGIGAVIHPLHVLKIDGLGVGFDTQMYEDGMSSFHLGSFWFLGNRWINIIPKVGVAFNDRSLFGEKHNIITCGFSTMLGLLSIGTSFEYMGDGRYDVGLKLGIGN